LDDTLGEHVVNLKLYFALLKLRVAIRANVNRIRPIMERDMVIGVTWGRKRSRFGKEVGKVVEEGVYSWVYGVRVRCGSGGDGLDMKEGVDSMGGYEAFKLV
jgi:hypothetical protein